MVDCNKKETGLLEHGSRNSAKLCTFDIAIVLKVQLRFGLVDKCFMEQKLYTKYCEQM